MTENPEGTPPDENLIEEEEDAAAAEAGHIGGRSGMEGVDPAERPVAESGEGVSEGFEEAEALLEDQAEHGDPLVDPLTDAPAAEAEPDPATYGEADAEEPADS